MKRTQQYWAPVTQYLLQQKKNYHLSSERQCKVINDEEHALQTVQEGGIVKLLTMVLKLVKTRLQIKQNKNIIAWL